MIDVQEQIVDLRNRDEGYPSDSYLSEAADTIERLNKELERLTPKGLRDESKRTNSKGSYSRASSH